MWLACACAPVVTSKENVGASIGRICRISNHVQLLAASSGAAIHRVAVHCPFVVVMSIMLAYLRWACRACNDDVLM